MKSGKEFMYEIFEDKERMLILLQNKNCPSVFGLSDVNNCYNEGDCAKCWENALNKEYR